MSLTEITTVEEPEMIPAFAPVWAEVFGEDRYGIFAEFVLNKVRFVWRWIPPGRFKMGSPSDEKGRFEDEGPQHDVVITRGYWLGETPMTQEQWSVIIGKNPSRFQEPMHPVEQVSWNDCQAFVLQLNDRVPGLSPALPTEAQWEYACRAGTQGAFHIEGSKCTEPEGEDPVLDQLGWYSANSEKKTHPVKAKSANDWGLYDMHGNVWEWCRDGKREYSNETQVNPIGPVEEGAFRVVRGGSWGYQARSCRAAFRDPGLPGGDWGLNGLRLSAGQELEKSEAEPLTAERS